MKVITWEGGFVCTDNRWVLCRIDQGHQDHKEKTSNEHGDNKSPAHSYPICFNTKKKQWRMNPMSVSTRIIRNIQPCVTQPHLWISQQPSRGLPCFKLKGIKQLQAKVSTQLGILSSHKVLYQRPSQGQRVQREACGARLNDAHSLWSLRKRFSGITWWRSDGWWRKVSHSIEAQQS